MNTYDPVAEFASVVRTILAALGVIATSVVLLACSDAKPISFYKANAAERADRVAQCVASGSDTEDCRNAKQAEFELQGIPAANGRAL